MPRLAAIALTALLLAACGPRTYQVPAQVAAPVAQATAWVEITPEGENGAHVVLHVENLTPIHRLDPDKRAYIVWALPPGEEPQNLGTLRVTDDGAGIFVTQAPVRHFELVVTPEDDIDAPRPTGQEVLRARLDQ